MKIDQEVLRLQKLLFKKKAVLSMQKISPISPDRLCEGNELLGKKAIAEGKVAALIVAGGQGSRLGFPGPKGMVTVKGCSLFEHFAKKIQKAGEHLPLAIMTSNENDKLTQKFFKEHAFFGLNPSNVHFFRQNDLPLLDETGEIFNEREGKLAVGPNGNGEALSLLYASGIWGEWKKKGVKYVTFSPIDNFLANPFDPLLIGAHMESCEDVVIHAIARNDPLEKVGILAEGEHGVIVVEYSEISKEDALKREASNRLRYPLANISVFSFSMEMIQESAAHSLPLHLAHKKCMKEGVMPEYPNAWKFETFIFDTFSFAKGIKILVSPREKIFLPIKSKEDLQIVKSI